MSNKLALISDIHGNIYAFLEVLKDIKNKGISFENVYCLGDSVGYGTKPDDVVNLLKEYSITSVLGNYDKTVAFYKSGDEIKDFQKWTVDRVSEENKAYIREFKENISFSFKDKKILLTHASPNSIKEYVFFDDIDKQNQISKNLKEDIVVFGHTHIPYKKYVNDKLFINAGSVGKPKDNDNRANYVILTFDDEIQVEFIKVDYNYEKIATELENSTLPKSYANQIRTGTA